MGPELGQIWRLGISNENEDRIGCSNLAEFIFRFQRKTLFRETFLEFTLLDQFENNVESALEFAFYVDLGEGGPFGVEF